MTQSATGKSQSQRFACAGARPRTQSVVLLQNSNSLERSDVYRELVSIYFNNTPREHHIYINVFTARVRARHEEAAARRGSERSIGAPT
jgi:hypothetical protein